MFWRSLLGTTRYKKVVAENSYLNIPSKSVLKPIAYGQYVPNFKFTPVGSNEQQIADWLERSAVVLIFFRGTWCPNCVRELHSIQEEIEEFEIKNIEVLAISPDKIGSTEEFKETGNIKYHLISDPGNAIARMFNISVPLKETVSKVNKNILRKKLDIDVDHYEVPVPATYIIGKGGNVLYNFIDYDFTTRVQMKNIPDLAFRLVEEDEKEEVEVAFTA